MGREESAHCYYMAQLMPADCEEFEGVYEDSCAWNMPYSKYDNGVNNNLSDIVNRQLEVYLNQGAHNI